MTYQDDMIMNVEPGVKTETFVEHVQEWFRKGYCKIHVHFQGQYVGMIVTPREAEKRELI